MPNTARRPNPRADKRRRSAAYANALRKLGDDEQASGPPAAAAKRLIHHHYRKALELAPHSDAMHAQYALALCEFGDLDNA